MLQMTWFCMQYFNQKCSYVPIIKKLGGGGFSTFKPHKNLVVKSVLPEIAVKTRSVFV